MSSPCAPSARFGDGRRVRHRPGRKTFITNGALDGETLGDAFVVYATTGEREISSFLVEKGNAGFSLGQKWSDKLGCRASFTAELVFDGVRVPESARLGDEGEGTLQMMRNLEVERLTLAAMSVGIAERSLRVMVDYANERTAFGVPIREHGQIQRYIAETYAAWIAARTFVYDTARKIDLASTGQRVQADAAKLLASQMAKAAADNAIQVLGGVGYMGESVVERLCGTRSCSRSAVARSRRPQEPHERPVSRSREARVVKRGEMAARLGAFVAEQNGGVATEVRNLRRLAGGASREIWAFEAQLGEGSDARTLDLVMRRDRRGARARGPAISSSASCAPCTRPVSGCRALTGAARRTRGSGAST